MSQSLVTSSRQSAPTAHRKRSVITVAGLLAVGAALSACSSDADPAAESAPVTVTVTSEAPPSTEAAPSSTVEAPVVAEESTSDAAPVVDFVMPNLVGIDLQTAQNTIQDNGVFYSVSHDLRGSRNQLLDSNWIVCTQSVAAGQRVTGDVEGQIDLGAVKRGETCP